MAYLLALRVVVVLPTLVCASHGFLQPSLEKVLTPDQLSVVLATIEESLGEKHRQATEVRLAPLESILSPTLKALPKNEYGKFGQKGVRYALHRFFVKRHAWFVNGFGQDIKANNASAAELLEDGVPEQIQSFFEARLGNTGLSAHEVAVMAATFENLADQESIDRLRAAHQFAGLQMGNAGLSAETVNLLLDIYLAAFTTQMNLTWFSENYRGRKENAALVLIDYARRRSMGFFDDAQSLIHEIKAESLPNRSVFFSMDVSRIVTRFGDRYGRWQNYECADLKNKLLSLEDDGSGRVSLSKFYNGYVNLGHRQFQESPEYLRSMGALDESNPSNPRVIVTNYVYSPAQCAAASKYYAVCCLNECEDYMDKIEGVIQAPAAVPERIAEIVMGMPSSTTRGNHTISAHLRSRLDEIASANDGLVPLHGRMLAQWLHHVYPLQCPYPHLSNFSRALRGLDYQEQTGLQALADREFMHQCIADGAGMESTPSSEITWSYVDEHYVEFVTSPIGSKFSYYLVLRLAALFSGLCSVAYFLRALNVVERIQGNVDDFKYV